MISALGLLVDGASLAGAGPAGPVAVTLGADLLGGFFHGGAATDATRQARADWFGTNAIQGRSVMAARILIGGTQNTASHESPMYDAEIAKVAAQQPNVMNAAYAAGPYWDTTDDATSSKMRALVTQEVASNGIAPVTPATYTGANAGTSLVTTTPSVRLVAPASSVSSTMMYWVLGGIVVVLGIAFLVSRRRGGA